MLDKRQQIVSAAAARLQTILVANGYQTDVGRNVFLWRVTDFGNTEKPGIAVRDPLRKLVAEYTDASRDYELTLEIVAVVSQGPQTEDQLDSVVEDVIACLLAGDRTFGGLAIDTKYDSDEKVFDHQNERTGSALVKFLIQYRV